MASKIVIILGNMYLIIPKMLSLGNFNLILFLTQTNFLQIQIFWVCQQLVETEARLNI